MSLFSILASIPDSVQRSTLAAEQWEVPSSGQFELPFSILRFDQADAMPLDLYYTNKAAFAALFV